MALGKAEFLDSFHEYLVYLVDIRRHYIMLSLYDDFLMS